MCMGVLPVCTWVKYINGSTEGSIQGRTVWQKTTMDGVCEQHSGSHGHWAQRVLELRNTCPSLGDGWDVSKEK